MATYTSNYAWTKPSGNDNVDISVLNANLDSQDSIIHDAFMNMAQAFSESSTYEVGDIVVYQTTTYKCHTAVTTAGSWTGSTNWQVYKLSEGGGGGGTSDYTDLTNKPQINGVTLTGNKTTGDLGLQDKMQYSTMPTASADNVGKIYQYVGTTDANYTNGYYYKCVENSGSYSWQLVENIKEQTPTFSQASTRNNIASGEKLSVIMGKIQKFFNDLKTVAFSGSYADLSNKPNAENIMLSDGTTSVEDALDDIYTGLMRMTKLWENANPTSAYSARNISDIATLREYDAILMQVKYYTSINTFTSVLIFKNERGVALMYDASSVAARGVNGYQREITFDAENNMIVVANAYYGYTGQAKEQNNNYLIPRTIYGIKIG